jgi:hypothetical protein
MTQAYRLRPITYKAAVFAVTAAFLAGCQATKQAEEPAAPSQAAYNLTRHIGDEISRCWYDEASVATFGKYSYSPEPGNTPPRILLVPKDKPTDPPVLVIEAVGANQVNLFGPFLDSPAGARIRTDVDRWAKGGEGC